MYAVRMKILTDFATRVPELYLKATLEEKRMILTTIAESITIDDEAGTIIVKLRPVFERGRERIQKKNRKKYACGNYSDWRRCRSDQLWIP